MAKRQGRKFLNYINILKVKEEKMNKEEIYKIVENENVKFIKLLFVDLMGELKEVEVSVNELESTLSGKIMIDGSNIKGLTVVNEADVMLKPDLESFRRLPFYDSTYGNVACFMCDFMSPEGKAIDCCTRTNLKRELSKMVKAGFDVMNVGYEPEFFILKNKPTSKIEKQHLIDNDAYCAIDGTDISTRIRREIMYELERVGIHCTTSHHEVATSQYEVTYKYADALRACDNFLLVKMLVKAVVAKNGMAATFMPKPCETMAGNGLHTNISLVKEGKNIFANQQGNGLSDVAISFITGVLTHARGLSLLTNPTINSYKRLGLDGFEAPVSVCWGESNRSSMIRVPNSYGNSSRAEIRITDSSCNPYLAAAGILASGLDGIVNKIPHIKPVERNIFSLTSSEREKLNLKTIALKLGEAVFGFETDEVLLNCMPSVMAKKLINYKKAESETYRHVVNSFDFDNYF
ncbi:MAG: glutamine synthetase family protein [Firmicutes bacterium]|nr:glutamine synthetase family protein [Bacillota bacterium]